MTPDPDIALVRETLGWGSYDPQAARWVAHYDATRRDETLAALARLEARIAEQDARWQEMDHPYNKSEVDALHARIAELERRDRSRRHLAARAERYAEALRRIDYGIEVDWALGVDENCERLREVARAALADQPPAENTDFEWKMQEC